MNTPNSRYLSLEALRGICALSVVAYHAQQFGHAYKVGFISSGYLLVDFFFVLSGFIISLNYYDRISTITTLLKFMILRFGRLFPLHLFFLAVFMAYELLRYILIAHFGFTSGLAPFAFPERALESFLSHIFFLNSFGIFEKGSWNAPSWSIGAEFYTYLVFACMILLIRKPALQIVSLSMLAVFGALIVWIVSPDLMNATYDLGFFRCVFGFSVGCLVANVTRLSLIRHCKTSNVSSVSTLAHMSELLSVLMVVFFVGVLGGTNLEFLAPILFGFVVFVFSFDRGLVSIFLRHKLFIFLGKISFSIYMSHLFIIIIFEQIRIRFFSVELHDAFLGDIVMFILFSTTVVVSSFTFNFIEVPWRSRFRLLAAKFDEGVRG